MTRVSIILLMCIVCASNIRAQETSTDWAWKPILEYRGVSFEYIFYSEADNENNGVVLKLVNRNDYPVTYRFLAIFKADGAREERLVSGRIEARAMITGAEEGLFFVPFKDGRSIGEIGLKGYRVYRRG